MTISVSDQWRRPRVVVRVQVVYDCKHNFRQSSGRLSQRSNVVHDVHAMQCLHYFHPDMHARTVDKRIPTQLATTPLIASLQKELLSYLRFSAASNQGHIDLNHR